MSLLAAIWRSTSEEDLLARCSAWLKVETDAQDCDIILDTQQGLHPAASTQIGEARRRWSDARFAALARAAFDTWCPVEGEVEGHSPSDDQPAAKKGGAATVAIDRVLALPISGPEGIFGVAMAMLKPGGSGTALRQDLGCQVYQALHLYRTALALGTLASPLTAVTEVTKTISQSPYLEEILQLLVHMTAQRFNYKVVTVRLLDETRQALVLRATQASNKAYQNKRAIGPNESIAGRVLNTGKFVTVLDVQQDPEYVGHDLAAEQGLRSMICLPLMVQGKPVGVISCYTGRIHVFDDEEVAALEALAKQAALAIEHAKLSVRSTLMQEMHHRVKNNLQQVASLLRLQMRQSHYKDSTQALTDSLSRILAIAAVHDLLSRDDLDHVEVRELAEMLAHHLQQSMVLPGSHIGISVRGDRNIYLNTSQATQVALIMNEMVQNALEHGFAKVPSGEIHVSVEQRDGEIGIWVSNNGDPLPEGFDSEKGRLGLQIIHSLARALGGRFIMENRLGWTVCEVRFKRAGAE